MVERGSSLERLSRAEDVEPPSQIDPQPSLLPGVQWSFADEQQPNDQDPQNTQQDGDFDSSSGGGDPWLAASAATSEEPQHSSSRATSKSRRFLKILNITRKVCTF